MQEEQGAFGIGQRAALVEKLVQPLPRKAQAAGQFRFLATPGELCARGGRELIPERCLATGLERHSALRSAVALAFDESLPDRFARGFGEGHREVEWNAERGRQLRRWEMGAHAVKNAAHDGSRQACLSLNK